MTLLVKKHVVTIGEPI